MLVAQGLGLVLPNYYSPLRRVQNSLNGALGMSTGGSLAVVGASVLGLYFTRKWWKKGWRKVKRTVKRIGR